MGSVTQKIAIIGLLLVLSAAGYLTFGMVLSDSRGGGDSTVWLLAFVHGLLVATIGWYLLRAAAERAGRAKPGSTELIELSEEIRNLKEASTLYFLLSERLASVVRWERAALFVLDEDHSRFMCRRLTGEDTQRSIEGLTFRRSDPFFQQFLDSRNLDRSPSVAVGEMIKGGGVAQAMRSQRLPFLVPLVTRRQLVGFLMASSRPNIPDGQENLLKAVMAQGAAALDALLLIENEAIDRLTGFLRSSLFDGRLEEEIRRSRRLRNAFSVLVVDIDELREVNERWGDEAGNEVIQRIARAIREKLRKSDFASRSSGEEFTILLPDTDAGQAKIVAENLRAHVEKLQTQVEEGGEAVTRTISIGIAMHHPEEPTFGDEILQRARKAILQAKTSGKNAVAVYSDALPL